ncbi:invasion protein IalB [Amaricoccus macauensis]|uniref:Invasion protein IalB n=1 Tax=Amaricoccus macauensis TaxID=57001 RepID=A0A840SIR1_9RHOB|nr:invasion associated locus B family protein [Amaricoccus macauensis]MBB5220650.1 invasion protein IalB [Amaricoccus macauensis]
MQILRPHLIAASAGIALSALALTVMVPAFAQEAPAPAAEAPATPAPGATPASPTTPAAPETPEATAPAAPGAPAPDAAAGNPAQQEPMEIVKETFGDWQVRCAPEGNDCFLYQLALDQDKNPVAEVSLLKLPASAEAAAGATVVSPLGTLLTTGVVLQVDGGEKRSYPFAWCSQVGCFSRFGLSQQSIDSLKRGNSVTLSLVSVNRPEEPVSLAVSLKGFTAAFDSLETPPSPAGAAPADRSAPAAPAKPLPNLLPRN